MELLGAGKIPGMSGAEMRNARALEYLSKCIAALEGCAAEIAAGAPLTEHDRETLAPMLEVADGAMQHLREAMSREDRPPPRMGGRWARFPPRR